MGGLKTVIMRGGAATMCRQPLSSPAARRLQFGRARHGCGGVRWRRQEMEGLVGHGHRKLGFGVQGPPGHPCCGWLPPRTPAWLTICWLLHMTSPLSCPPWLRDKTSGKCKKQQERHNGIFSETGLGNRRIYLFTTATQLKVQNVAIEHVVGCLQICIIKTERIY